MRLLTRTIVTLTAAAGLAAGSLTGASAGFAATAPAAHPAATSRTAVPFATVNLGLNATQAGYVQCWLKANWGYTGRIDGELGTNSWKAFQRNLRTHWGYTGAIDGEVGGGTVSALQRLLRNWGYTGAIDGIAGSGTQAAFKQFADGCAGWC
ncbi:peptidoglycan-binding protein [Streptomyces sp. NPDC002566]|uniref:peptidoglycan-binding domain-containing protein n=1 Tax=Streptomyces sp. NPDC002566 TaxID=3364650 RepID=UPI00367C2877